MLRHVTFKICKLFNTVVNKKIKKIRKPLNLKKKLLSYIFEKFHFIRVSFRYSQQRIRREICMRDLKYSITLTDCMKLEKVLRM